MTSLSAHNSSSPHLTCPPTYHDQTTPSIRSPVKPRTIQVDLGTEKLVGKSALTYFRYIKFVGLNAQDQPGLDIIYVFWASQRIRCAGGIKQF